MIIHLLAPDDKSKWDEVWHQCYNKWKISPYEIKLWNDEDIDQLLIEDDKEFFDILNTLHPIYKFDYVRYIILEKFGGAYFDMDVEIIIDFIPLLDPKQIYIMEGRRDEFLQNSIMISPPEYLVWDSVKKYCKFNVLNNLEKCKSSDFWVVYMVGPIALSNYFSRFSPPFEMLSYHHFHNPESTLSFSKHYSTSVWATTPRLYKTTHPNI
jgi:mannosyltransferase OCH1-like enzyme